MTAVAGLAAIGVAALAATAFAPAERVRASLEVTGDRPVVSTAPGVLDMVGPRVGVTVTDGPDAAGIGGPLFVGIGRESDVTEYLAEVSRTEVTGLESPTRLASRAAGSDADVPAPQSVDVWVSSSEDDETAELGWTHSPGRWALVVARDGSAPAPSALLLTWDRDVPLSGWVVVLGVAGAVLVLAAALLMRTGRRAG